MSGRRGRQGGFTLIELVITIAVIGIVAAIAVPALRYALLWSRATRAVTDFNFFRTALIEYYGDTGQMPPETSSGTEPPELAPYLGGQMEWVESGFSWDWENWQEADGTPTHPETGVLYALSVRTTDPSLLTMMRTAWQGDAHEIAGYGYTLVIVGVGNGGLAGGDDPGALPMPGGGADPADPSAPPAQPAPPGGGGAVDPLSAAAVLSLAWAATSLRRGR